MLHRILSQRMVALFILVLCVASCRETVRQSSEFASTYLGGKDHEFCDAIALDDDGNIYVAGNTRSLDFPTTPGAYNRESRGKSDVFIAKFDNELKTLLASTLIGGEEDECAYAILCDPEGYVYVAGYTSSENFPTTDRCYDSGYNGGDGDAFILKMDKDLKILLSSTYLGGSGEENDWRSPELAQDDEGNIYIAGITGSDDFPTTSGAFQERYNGGERDVFVSKLDPELEELLASTLLGGTNDDRMGRSLSLDAKSHQIYVGGYTFSPDFPTSENAYNREVSGNLDGFIARLSTDLKDLTASTILDAGWIYGMMIHQNGDIYVGGHAANRLPTTPGAFYQTFDKSADQGFISRLSGDLSKLVASTVLPGSYAGGGGRICSLNLCQTEDGHVLSAGWVHPLDFPVTAGVFDETQNGNGDTYILKMDNDLSRVLRSTFIGGSRSERWNRMTTDGKGRIYLASYTLSGDFPTTGSSAFQEFGGVIDDDEENLNTSARDAFIIKIDGDLSAETFEEIHEAAKRDQADKLQKLLSKDENRLEKRDTYQRTPLHSAARYGALSAARILLGRGADPNAKDENGNTPLHLASSFRHHEIIDLLIHHKADANMPNARGQTPLILAALYGNAGSITSLMAAGEADIDIRDADGNAPLHIASLYQNHENLAAILKANPDNDAINTEGDTPLLVAVRRPDNGRAVELLLQHGADPNRPDHAGKNALLASVGSNQKDYIRMLVSKGIDINSQDEDGNTALHYTLNNVLRGVMYLPYGKGMVAALMKEGADPSIKNNEGKSPMNLARESGVNELIDLLVRQELSTEEQADPTFAKESPGLR